MFKFILALSLLSTSVFADDFESYFVVNVSAYHFNRAATKRLNYNEINPGIGFEIHKNKTIDGSVRWNIARYCNHACEEAGNAESDVKKGRVFIKAIKNIKEGEEIVYDYGEEFVNEYIAPKGCRCKAKEHSYKAKVVSSV